MFYKFIINGDTVEINTPKMVAIVNDKIIQAFTFPQFVFRRHNRKFPNNTIIRGCWN